MDTIYQSPTLSNDENVINILVFQQDDNNISTQEQALIMPDNTQHSGSQRAMVSSASPALSGTTCRGSLSSCPQEEAYNWFQGAPKANSTPRSSLYKSQSFTVGQCEVGLQYPDLDDLRAMSGFCNNLLKWDSKMLSNPMETNTEGLCPSQPSVMTDTQLLTHSDNKRLKHKSINIPVGYSGVDALSPGMLVRSLKPSSISSLTATPDSGFWSPGSSMKEEPAASPVFSTPKRFKFEVKTEPGDLESPRAVNEVLVAEPPPMTNILRMQLPPATPVISVSSMTSSSQQSVLAPLSTAPMVSSKQAMSAPLPWLSMAPSKQTVLAPMPQLRMAPVVSSSQTVLASRPQLGLAPSKHTGSASVPQLSMASTVPSKQAVSAPLPKLRMAPMDSSSRTVLAPQLSLVPGKQILSTPLPQLSMTAASTLPYHLQERKVLQELNSNLCYNPVKTVQPTKPQYERPSYSYMDLIKMALNESEDGQLTLKEIQAWMEDRFPHFKYNAKPSWKSSVRCNLSLHQDFTKVDAKKRGGKWKVAEGARSCTHRLPKPPVAKQAAGSKVPAVTRLKSRRSGPLPILPKSVPYALVPVSLTTLEPNNNAQNIHDQAVQILQHQRPTVLQPMQVQPILQNPQPQSHLMNSQNHLLAPVSSTNPLRPKSCLQQIAPKVNLNPTTLVWDSQSFVVPNYNGNNGQTANSHVETESVSNRSGVSQTLRGVNTSSIAAASDIGKTGLVSRLSIPDHVLQPIDIQIQPGSVANEKKIVFILKQRQEQEKPINDAPVSMPTEYSSHHVIRDNKILKNPTNTRSICKTVDGIQRSKSDLGNRSSRVRPYSKGKSEDCRKKAPVVNLEHLLKREKQDESAGKIFTMKDDDCDNDLPVEFLTHFYHSSKNSAAHRPESAPAKCLIQQAWDQASTLSEGDLKDGHLLGAHSSRDHENSNQIHRTNGSETTVSSLTLPAEIAISAASESQPNVYYFVCNDFSKGLDYPAVQRTVSCHDNANTVQYINQEVNNISTGRENVKDLMSSQYRVISENVSSGSTHTIDLDKSDAFTTGAKECQTIKNHIPVSVMAEKTRKITFYSTPNSQRSITSLPYTRRDIYSNKDSVSKDETTSLAKCSPQFTVNRTKSRRKQIHTPMSTNSSPDRDTSCLDSTNGHLKAGSDVGLTDSGLGCEIVRLCQTPPPGSHHTSQATSSPISHNPSPLDFAAFLSTLSTSPNLNFHKDSTVPSVSRTAELIPNPTSKSSTCTNLPHSSSTTPARIPVSFSPSCGAVEDSGVVESSDKNLLPTSSSTMCHIHSTPGVTSSRLHFLNTNLSFHSSAALSLASAELNESLPLMPSGQFDNFLRTPPVGSHSVPTASTPSHGMHLAQENQPVANSSSGLLDSSLFDTLDSFMHNLYEFKTP